MKKLALFICLFTITISFSQTTKEDLIGKWQLLTLTIDGTVLTTYEAVETDDFYHEYLEDKTFKTTLDETTDEGTWELSGETLNIFLSTKSGEIHFKILEISADELHVLDTEEEEEIILSFKKV
ncbi:hypothetical protein FORMB_26140 [Formosa sp. Hel1_33_131]|jgi:hypothetical protein|uniref:lipocalin family protein n=1 Tax=Formosa sp. Hel1_33_131 TaxID=1336794 RepID=UPI00084E21A5|nr:lipocalin family protein [Formosa sp. Hel1_33_131]AOR29630.1 hypothetical protein FORMB_26140 [Formosa sp. Hel1_33_131]